MSAATYFKVFIIYFNFNFLGDAKENTLLLLLNAVYFKGLWTHPFNANLTKNGPFYLDSKTIVEVPLMTTFENFEISTIESLKAKIISLPYEVCV